jgi:nucleoside-diphosphate-sugar epimerase
MILVTGSNGFVGSAMVQRLAASEGAEPIVAAARSPGLRSPAGVRTVGVGGLSSTIDWSDALHGVRSVVHCAARVHVMDERGADPLQTYRDVNVQGTLRLAQQAALAGVRRLVFISSIKVNGESTQAGAPFTADDTPAPLDPYGVSKLEAEQGLRALAARTGMEVVIVRPPLVYGAGVKANFGSLLKWVARGVPLPLGAIDNARSMVALDNLVDLVCVCLSHPAAAGHTFLVSDGEDVSTTELLRRAARAMGKSARLVPVPPQLLSMGAALLGRQALAQRLCGSLQVDIQKTRSVLAWAPPITLDQGLRKAVQGLQP